MWYTATRAYLPKSDKNLFSALRKIDDSSKRRKGYRMLIRILDNSQKPDFRLLQAFFLNLHQIFS
jgi:hypothetical protein